MNITIVAWNSEAGWTTLAAYHPRDLERRLVRLTGYGRGEIKRLVRRLKNHECFTLQLPQAEDRFAATSFRNLPESVGALVQIDNADQGPVAHGVDDSHEFDGASIDTTVPTESP